MEGPEGLARFGRPAVRALLLLAGLALAIPVAAGREAEGTKDVRGLWVDHPIPEKRKVAVWIEDCAGLLCGHIYWLKKPMSPGGRPKRDHHNPDDRLRSRPLCGLRILSGFRRTDYDTWSAGQIYNPSDGRTFSSTMTLEHDGKLRIRGYLGVPLLGKTVAWVRPQDPPGRCG